MSQVEQTPHYGMYSDLGDAVVGVFVSTARVRLADGASPAEITDFLQKGRKDVAEAGFPEVEDTVVREAIYQVLETQAIRDLTIANCADMLAAIEAGLT